MINRKQQVGNINIEQRYCIKKMALRGILKLGKVFFILFFIFTLGACNGENAPDCIQNAGGLVRKEIPLSVFNKITVFEKVALVLKQGDDQKVEIETGEFLIKEVSAKVEGDRLILENGNGCNLFRRYGLTTVYVTSPDITEIRSSTGLKISSSGILDYPSLTLLSESFVDPEAETTDGEFDLEVNTTNMNVTVNGLAYVRLRGSVESLSLSIAAGDSRIEAKNLVAQRVNIDHRGSNDMQVNPQESLSGIIRATGNVISYNRPGAVDVDEVFNGRLIFKQ